MSGLVDVFNTTLSKGLSILVDNPIPTPKPAGNIQHTPSNVNQVFKTVNSWNDQIDNEILSLKQGEKFGGCQGFIVKCPALFIEFEPGDGDCILGGVTQYMDAKIYFHIYSDELATDNRSGQPQLMDANFQIDWLRDVITTNFNGFHCSFGSAMMNRFDKLDYKHGTITKYIKGFSFCWNDTKGSVYDPKSPRYLTTQTIPSFSVYPQTDWVSGTNYVALINCVYLNVSPPAVGYWLCTISNSDVTFNPSNWLYCPLWASGTTYAIGNYVAFGYFCYQCLTANSDIIFNQSNWNIICRL